jgi:hypothetical protein
LSNGTHRHKPLLTTSLTGKEKFPQVFPSLLMVLQHGFRMNDAHLQPLFALSTLNMATVLEAFDALRPMLMG